SENEDHHASKAGRPTCEQTLTADTPNVKKDHRSERVLCRPSLTLSRRERTRAAADGKMRPPKKQPKTLRIKGLSQPTAIVNKARRGSSTT
ncbi:hypothetical protein WCQ02_27125, partial [Paraburkholderia tropica]|uniref:hypothetical protein n=1 Tax=Paraburkholderia tropica TaxID=92647 RepID=UPI003019742A